MIRDITELADLRDEAIYHHQAWKRRIFTLDSIAADEWQTVWDDLTADIGEPLVENTLLEALEDKVAAAASVRPRIDVHPRRGTKQDRAERSAERRTRVIRSYRDRSFGDKQRQALFFDWYGAGAAYLMPWADLYDMDGRLIPSFERFPYQVRINPRHVYPLAHNAQGRMTAALVTKLRTWKDIKEEYGENHPGVQMVRERFQRADDTGIKESSWVEETWYFDDDDWAVGLTARAQPAYMERWRYVAPTNRPQTSRIDEWLFPPANHGLLWNPLAEMKRTTNDGEYRSPLDTVIPRLKVAQNFMARLLDQVADVAYGPVLMEGILNPEDYGPEAELIGDGSGNARVEYPRAPISFETRQVIIDQLQMARKSAKHPEQRAGEAGVSIGSAKHTDSLMGAFNDELRVAHQDIAGLMQWANVLTANYDEVHCGGSKTVEGVSESGAWVETYNPESLFKGDYRNTVSYGAAAGLDRHNLMTVMALGRNMKGVSQRRFMSESGLVEDVLQEERDILIEDLTTGLLGVIIGQSQEAGNTQPLESLIDKLDGDTMSVRQAVSELVKEMRTVPAGGSGVPAGGDAGPDPLRQVASLEAGGAGVEGGLTDVGARLRRVMPANVNRALNQ